MATTALIVEMIVVGLQAAVWIVMLLAFAWVPDKALVDEFAKFGTPLTFVAVGFCYTIGLIVDSFTAFVEDLFFPPMETAEEKAKRREVRQRLRVTHREVYAALDRDQYMLRLLRSTVFNIFAVSVVGSLMLLKTVDSLSVLSVLGCLVLYVFAFAYPYVCLRSCRALEKEQRTCSSGDKRNILEKQLERARKQLTRVNKVTLSGLLILMLFLFMPNGLRLTRRSAWAFVVLLTLWPYLTTYGWWRRRVSFTRNRDVFYEVAEQELARLSSTVASNSPKQE